MRFLLILMLASCGDPIRPPSTDAFPDADTDCIDGVHTWRDTMRLWDGLRCSWAARCFPDEFLTHWSNLDECVDQLSSQNCIGWIPEGSCEWPYPLDRCELIIQCVTDVSALPCDREVLTPQSCRSALR